MDYHKTKLFAESWNVAYRKRSPQGVPGDLASPFQVIGNSFRYWAADPFVFEEGNDTFIFAELYDYIKRRGVIGYCRINEKNRKWIPVIEEPYHLSFPFLYREAGDIFLLPEAGHSGCLYSYRAVHFPDKWEKHMFFLRNVNYADTTPFFMFGKQLALTYDLSHPSLRILNLTDGNDCLADSASPELKRPAGFIDAKAKVRAAQNCSVDYGKGLVFYQFKLDQGFSYHEEEFCRIGPEDIRLNRKLYRDGLHTYQRSENYEVIDIKTRRFNILNFIMRIVSKRRHHT